jgi:hypothetical protein
VVRQPDAVDLIDYLSKSAAPAYARHSHTSWTAEGEDSLIKGGCSQLCKAERRDGGRLARAGGLVWA